MVSFDPTYNHYVSFFNEAKKASQAMNQNASIIDQQDSNHRSLYDSFVKAGLYPHYFINTEFQNVAREKVEGVGIVISSMINSGLSNAGYKQAKVWPMNWVNKKTGAIMLAYAYCTTDNSSPPIYPNQSVVLTISEIQKKIFGENVQDIPKHWEYLPEHEVYQWVGKSPIENQLIALTAKLAEIHGLEVDLSEEDGQKHLVLNKDEFEHLRKNELYRDAGRSLGTSTRPKN